MSNFNVNYQFNAQVNKNPVEEKLIAITPYHHVEVISKNHLLLSHTANQQSTVLAMYLSTVIEVLKTFRTTAEHIKEIKTFMGLDNSAAKDIKNVIHQLQQLGFIITAEDALAGIKSEENYQPLQTQPVVVVRTAGRVSMLKRFLQSAVDNELRYNARYEYLIIDDSKPELAEANAKNIKDSGLNVNHIDRKTQRTLLEKWQSEFPEDVEAIEFLLGDHSLHTLSKTYGRTWNWGILLSAGRPTVYLDDDCLLEAYQAPFETQTHLSLGKLDNETTFLSKEKSLREQLQPSAIDPIARLAEVLGLTPKQLPCDTDSFDRASSQTLPYIEKATVKIACPAVAGDPGSDSPMWLYYMRGESAQRFWGNDEKAYLSHIAERFNWAGYKQPLLSFGGSYSVVARSFDNRALLPPTLPIFRNEDALFTNLVHYLYPNGASLSLPWGISHLPEVERTWTDKLTPEADGFDLVQALDDFLESEASVPQTGKSPKDRLLQLDQQLSQLTQSDKTEILRWCYQKQQGKRANTLKALMQAQEASPNAPDYWQRDVSNFISANLNNEQPLNFAENIEIGDMIEVIKLFAKALPVWEKLWDASSTTNNV